MLFCELLQHEGVAWAKGGEYVAVTGLTLDSRKSGFGSLFFCIRGSRQDGHDYAQDAYRRGCRHFVAERTLALPEDASVLLCASVKEKMATVAVRYYGDPAKGMTLIGVTGTKGKTTTALMTRALLEAVGIRAAYIGSSGVIFGNTHIRTENTTPPSIETLGYLRMIADGGIATVVMEVSSQALANDRVFGFPFSVCVFTNFSRDHIGAGEHADMAAYRAAKMKLFTDFCPKVTVLNCEETFSHDVMKARPKTPTVLYGNGPGSSAKYSALRQYRSAGRLYTSFRLENDEKTHEVTLEFAGRHYVMDFLAALSTAVAVSGLDYERLLPFAPALSVPGRCEVYTAPSGALFVIDYAHNGASLGAALRGLRPYVEGRLLCLFGAVGERTKCRRADMAAAAERYADYSVITTDNPGGENAEAIAFEIKSAFGDQTHCVCIADRERAIYHLMSVAKKGDVVLLAGKGDEKYQISAEGKFAFDERLVVEGFGAVRN